ncbi:hypothetical protein CAPTEDRAFT_146466 [Capitella teleta]|uniref:2',3'-cyclic-nucleotide 3'-phosphodiesterase n=1 Tax=Capitella teleta TaxID=283909 RepID=R7TBC5_CAPTE|nr:hypothetical protein CAPTEDRAFT_146466 [Capitella teleta]|eukprot:ELT88772.1 hypothetical protein CAPTEDRAFT_146466 [Capitella teleta]
MEHKSQTGNECNFPFVLNESTVKQIKRSHVIFIMRGLPGSGKSTVVASLKSVYKKAVVCSADDYHMKDGEYHYDPEKKEEAHGQCQSLAKDACTKGCHVIIIDNTNVRRWEMKPYLDLASRHGYVVITVQPQTEWRFHPEMLSKLNKHKVPEDAIRGKLKAFEKDTPIFWGWFANRDDSESIRIAAVQYFTANSHPKVTYFIKIYASLDDNFYFSLVYAEQYKMTDQKILHCTTFFGGRNQEKSRQYGEKVEGSLGKAFGLWVIGFTVTPRTISARLALTTQQMALWAKDDDDLIGEFAQMSLRFGSRAHLTIGTSEGTGAVQAGLDLVEVIECESLCTDAPSVSMEDAVIRCYQKGRFAIYLNEPFRVPTIFTARY